MMAMMVAFSLQAHPDGATPYYYPSTFIYGFVDGCAEKIEQSQMGLGRSNVACKCSFSLWVCR